MKERLLSVVIPAHNAQESLERCLKSLFAQMANGFTFEVIVVVDASNDRTGEIARRFPVRCLIIDSRNRGVARNTGAQASHGELLFFVDADCALHPGSLERMQDHFSRRPFVAAAPFRFRGQAHFSSRELPVVATGACAYRRSVFQSLGGFDESLADCEDADLTMELLAAGHLIFLDPVALASHLRTRSRKRTPEKQAALRELRRKWPVLASLRARDAFRGHTVSPAKKRLSGPGRRRSLLGGILEEKSLRLIRMDNATQIVFRGLERDILQYLLDDRVETFAAIVENYDVDSRVLKRDVRAFAADIAEMGRIRWGRFADRL